MSDRTIVAPHRDVPLSVLIQANGVRFVTVSNRVNTSPAARRLSWSEVVGLPMDQGPIKGRQLPTTDGVPRAARQEPVCRRRGRRLPADQRLFILLLRGLGRYCSGMSNRYHWNPGCPAA